jgi:hypothetical protein
VLSSLGAAFVPQVSKLVARYIAEQRSRYLPRARPLSSAQTSAVVGFFSAELLDAVRVLTLEGEQVPDPDFYPMLRAIGFANLPSQASAAAITFSDVVVAHEPFSNDLLFHELVHVEQYRQLGIERFAELYVRGFLAGGGYDGIPLEVNAYRLGAHYVAEPRTAFSVANEVREWLVTGKF